MKVIQCPSCGTIATGSKHCSRCGCYLPPLLEEDYDWPRYYRNKQLRSACQAPMFAPANMNIQAQIYDGLQNQYMNTLAQISQQNQTQYILDSLVQRQLYDPFMGEFCNIF